MPNHLAPPVENFVPVTFQDAVWPWQQISTGTQAASGRAGVTAAGAPDRSLIGALGSGKSAMHGFVVGGGGQR